MATLIKVPAVFASYILCSLLVGCDVNSDVGVDQESAPTLDVRVQASAPESKVVADAVSEVSLVKSVVPLAQLVEDTVDLPEPLTFTVVTYNVENLFDADGVAMFDDYKVDSGYTPRKLLTKLQAITNVLKSVFTTDFDLCATLKSTTSPVNKSTCFRFSNSGFARIDSSFLSTISPQPPHSTFSESIGIS